MNKQSSAITDQMGHPISVPTANAPVPAAKAVSHDALDELACDMDASLHLLQAAVDLADLNGSASLFAVVSRALAELRGQHEVLCAML